jgi:hypothetical protein
MRSKYYQFLGPISRNFFAKKAGGVFFAWWSF